MVAFNKPTDNLKNVDNSDGYVYTETSYACDECQGSQEDGLPYVAIGDAVSLSSSPAAECKQTPPGIASDTEKASSNCSTVISSFLLVTLTCLLLFLGRDYVKYTLLWLEDQEDWIVFLLFVALFTLVSFPFTWGYILLNVACGYLQGVIVGVIVVVVAVTVGVLVAHLVIKKCLSDFFKTKLLSNEGIRATLAVVGGPHAFRVVAFTRLTPIPFGLQNAVFAISSISTSQYLAASTVGLLPTQVINVYLGSTVRSMEDVLSEDGTTAVGYIVFVIQVVISIGLLVYVVRRARDELRKTVQFQILDDESVASDDTFPENSSTV